MDEAWKRLAQVAGGDAIDVPSAKGQHNRAVARSLGYDEAAIGALEAAGVLHAEPAVAQLELA